MSSFRGGAKELVGKTLTDTNQILNRYLYKHDQKQGTKVIVKDSYDKIKPGSVLYVIDVQNDFIDIPQENLTGHPADGKKLGAFAVNNGSSFIESLTKHIESNIDNYSKIVFSRDFHDQNHCSFYTDGGTFPPHCVIGTYGSGFYPTLKKWLEEAMKDEKYKNKIDIVFKGMHPNKDSFTAVSIDNNGNRNNYYSKRQIGEKCCGSGMEKKDGDHKTGCGNAFTGSKKLNPDKRLNPLDDYLFKETEQTWNAIKDNFVDYDISGNGAHYYVCGLAGDFCVRDTAIALSDHGKKVSILHDYTRNAFVPANFPLTSTIYNPKVVYGDGPLNAYHLDDTNFSNKVLEEDTEKGFQYYMFKYKAGNPSTYTVPKLEQLKTANPGDYFHFLTDHRQIIDDYRKKKITMLTEQDPPDIATVGVKGGRRRTRKRSRRQRSKKQSTKKRSTKKRSTKKRSTKKRSKKRSTKK